MLCGASANADPQSDLDDAHVRSQYAFYTADQRTLEALIRTIDALEVPASLVAMKAYDAAYAYWKLALLQDDAVSANSGKPAPTRPARNAGYRSAQSCLLQTRAALTLDARMTEAYVLEAACSMITREIRSEDSRAPACLRDKSLLKAQQLEPRNPRVLLIEALCLRETAIAAAPSTINRLQTLVTTFDAAPPSRFGVPDWGLAEALLLLGENYQQRGETQAARDAIEKALVIAPDYRKAREVLEMTALRPR